MKHSAGSRDMGRAAGALTEGLFARTVDLALWFSAYMTELSVPFETYGKAWRAQVTADRFLTQVNYEVIKNGIREARRRHLLKPSNKRGAPPEITKEGKRRLDSLLPHYDEHRIWDGRMHLITYDIPEKRRMDREILREYLRRIGCGRLQDSVWMTPYNPIDTLRTFIGEHNLHGTIITSDLGKDGSIGEENLHSLVARVYDLKKLNGRYEEWIAGVKKTGIDHLATIQYFSILRDDPQVPFALLPSWWKGDEAYKAVKLT